MLQIFDACKLQRAYSLIFLKRKLIGHIDVPHIRTYIEFLFHIQTKLISVGINDVF